MAGMLSEYPAVPGNKPMAVSTVAGPASYTQVTTGTTPTGGQTIQAKDLGLVSIQTMQVSGSDNGQYGCHVIYPGNPQRGVSSVILEWFTLATGAQVAGAVDLSGRTVRITALGH